MINEKIKYLLEKSKKMGLIKPHTDAFKNNIVSEEEHKGQIIFYLK